MKNVALAITLTVTAAFPLAAQQGGCIGVAVGSEQKNAGKFDTVFSATEIIDVDFSVLLTPGAARRFAGSHVVEFRIHTPRGHLYQSIAIPFSSDANAKGKKVIVPGYPQPIETQLLTEVSTDNGKNLRATVRLPVAGTAIVANSLYGMWTAQAYVDGETLACSKPVTFTLTP